MEIAPRIAADENVRFGKPVIQGIRIPVDLLLAKLAGGMMYEELMTEVVNLGGTAPKATHLHSSICALSLRKGEAAIDKAFPVLFEIAYSGFNIPNPSI